MAKYLGAEMNEEWRPVKRYVGIYEVSDHGHLRSIDRWVDMSPLMGVNQKPSFRAGRIMVLRFNKRGFRLGCTLHKDGKSKWRFVDELVAEAFLGECKAPIHINGDTTDSSVSNLRIMENSK